MALLDRPGYQFLETDLHLGKHIVFLTCEGSYVYPETPDLARIGTFQMEVNEKVVRDEI